MRKFFFIAGVIAGLMLFNSGIARADCSPVELSGAYNYYRLTTPVTVTTEPSGTGSGTGTSTTANRGFNLNGWNAEAQANISCALGLVADFTALYGNPSIGGTKTTGTVYNTFFGPRFSFRNGSPITPFVEAFFGASHEQFGANASAIADCTTFFPEIVAGAGGKPRSQGGPVFFGGCGCAVAEPTLVNAALGNRRNPNAIITSNGSCTNFRQPESAFGSALGGGIDITVGPHLALRLRGDAVITTFGTGTQTNGGFTGGFVWRLGGGS